MYTHMIQISYHYLRSNQHTFIACDYHTRCRYENCALIISNERSTVLSFQLSNSGPAIIIGLIVIATQLVSLCCYRGPRNYLLSHVIAIVIVIGPRMILFPDRIDVRVFRGEIEIKPRVPRTDATEWWMHG